MKIFTLLIIIFYLLPINILGQTAESYYSIYDSIFSCGIEDPEVEYTQPINLTGSLDMMVIIIGFPDRNND